MSNCQILCSICNLKKNDKELNEFILDEKARNFLNGKEIKEDEIKEMSSNNINTKKITKEEFDLLIQNFINKKGDIKKIDFGREYNNLPSIIYVYKYYGDMANLKKSFGLREPIVWNRENIKKSLGEYIEKNGDIFEKDLKTCNNLPSYPCIMKYYPEYSGLNELKQDLFALKVRHQWTREDAIEAGKEFVKNNSKITLKDLRQGNGLPDSKVIYRYFGTMEEYQRVVGLLVSKKNEFIDIENIDKIVKSFFATKDRKFKTRKEFFDDFPVSQSVIYRRFGSFELFCRKYNIEIQNTKKAKYSKQEINDIILNYIKNGNTIPNTTKDLVKLGLPSRDAIMRYYEDWHEPFVLYAKLYEKIN